MTSQSGESEIRLSYLARASTRGLRRGVLLRGDVSPGNLNRKWSRGTPPRQMSDEDREREPPNLWPRIFLPQ